MQHDFFAKSVPIALPPQPSVKTFLQYMDFFLNRFPVILLKMCIKTGGWKTQLGLHPLTVPPFFLLLCDKRDQIK